MQRSSLCAVALPAALALFACGSGDSVPSAATVASSSSSSSSSSTGGAGGAGGQPSTGGAPAFVPLDAKTACDQPVKTEMGILQAAADHYVEAASVGWSGADAAVVWSESTATGFDIKFQLLLESGTTKGSYFTIGSSVASLPTVTLASNRTGFVACWDGATDATSFACASIDAASSQSHVGVTKAGRAPALTWGSGGYVVAFDESGQGHAQRLHDDATIDGTTKQLQVLMTSPLSIAPRSSTFSLYARDVAIDVDPLSLGVVGSVGKAGAMGTQPGVSISTSGDLLGFAWLDDTGTIVTSVAPKGSDVAKPGGALNDPTEGASGEVAIAGGKASFAVIWPVTDATLRYRATDDKGAPIGTTSTILSTGQMLTPVALTATSDGFLAAATVVSSGKSSLHLVHLGCP